MSTPPAGPPTVRHELTGADGGAHGELVHKWATDGVDPWFRVRATPDGTQVYTLGVNGQRGRVTASASADGNHREFFLHRASQDWTDMEVEATWHPPSAWVTTNPVSKPQLGLVLRAQPVPDTPGSWRAYVVWYDIAFSTSGMLANSWLVNGTATLVQGTQSPAFSQSINPVRRRNHVRYAARLDAFDAGQYRLLPANALDDNWGMVNGDLVTIAGMTTAAFNRTSVAVSNVAPRFFQTVDTTVTDATDVAAGGTVDFDYVPKSFFPRRVGVLLTGNDLYVRIWRPEEGPPEWSDSRVAKMPIPSAPALPEGPGFAGFMVGHCHDASYAEIGDVTMRRR